MGRRRGFRRIGGWVDGGGGVGGEFKGVWDAVGNWMDRGRGRCIVGLRMFFMALERGRPVAERRCGRSRCIHSYYYSYILAHKTCYWTMPWR